jgi:hypothetical protein
MKNGKQIIRLILDIYSQRDDIQNIGLINGKMGLCINLYHIAKFTQDMSLMKKADKLFDFIQSEISLSLPIHFANGLTGIGWGIQHLISEGLVDGDPDTVLTDIDILESEVTKYFPVERYRFADGTIGQMIYVISRLSYHRKKNDSMEILCLKVTLTSMIEKLNIIVENDDDLFYVPTETYWDIPVIAWILVELKKTGLYKTRVERLIRSFSAKLSMVDVTTNTHALMLQYTLHLLSGIGFPTENSKAKEYIPVNPNEIYNIALCFCLLSQISTDYEIQYGQWKEKLFKEDPDSIKKSLSYGFMGFYRLLY